MSVPRGVGGSGSATNMGAFRGTPILHCNNRNNQKKNSTPQPPRGLRVPPERPRWKRTPEMVPRNASSLLLFRCQPPLLRGRQQWRLGGVELQRGKRSGGTGRAIGGRERWRGIPTPPVPCHHPLLSSSLRLRSLPLRPSRR